eukprot:4016320-Prymnesium_polylepis.1
MPASVWQEHALSCGAPLKRVYGRGGPYYSSHSMGMVNVFRLVCDDGCCLNWSSCGSPVPGRPAGEECDECEEGGSGEEAADQAPTAAGGNGDGGGAELDAADVLRRLRRAVIFAKQTREKVELKGLAEEMGLARAGAQALGRVLKSQAETVA